MIAQDRFDYTSGSTYYGTACSNYSGLPFTAGIVMHELAETVSDPFPNSKPNWVGIQQGRYNYDNGEVADVCANAPLDDPFSADGFSYKIIPVYYAGYCVS